TLNVYITLTLYTHPICTIPRCIQHHDSRENIAYTFCTSQLSRARATEAWVRAAIARFSFTVSDGKIRRPCGTMLMPVPQMRCGDRRVISSPLSTIRPARAGVSPMSDRHSVRSEEHTSELQS